MDEIVFGTDIDGSNDAVKDVRVSRHFMGALGETWNDTSFGKFAGRWAEPDRSACHYFTFDDDIEYPRDYVERTMAGLQAHASAATIYAGLMHVARRSVRQLTLLTPQS